MAMSKYKYEYRIPKEEATYVEIVMRLYFHKFAHGKRVDGKISFRTNADEDEFRKIRNRAKCLKLGDETPDAEFMTEGELADLLYASCFKDYCGHKERMMLIVEDCETLEPIPLDMPEVLGF